MTQPIDQDHRPPYVRVADYLRRQIQTGELGPGDQLPSSRELQEKFGIASATVQNAFRALKNEGLIYGVQGKGSFVRRQAPEPGAADAGQAEGGASNDTPPKVPSDDRYFRLAMEVEDLKFQLSGLKQDVGKILTMIQQVADRIDGQEN
ncbi:GntR family transcriptional regulator [Streptomyces rubiginosohelvolus]|uniref:GntR family transcriptional regulator n=1 Tax=Streptomyces rubiginosohelvolus TaxID=67362 RepID=UPI003F8DB363